MARYETVYLQMLKEGLVGTRQILGTSPCGYVSLGFGNFFFLRDRKYEIANRLDTVNSGYGDKFMKACARTADQGSRLVNFTVNKKSLKGEVFTIEEW